MRGKNRTSFQAGSASAWRSRALANDPAVILADEPTGNLDTQNSRIVHDLFRHLVDTHGTSVVIVTHDEKLAAKTDRQIHLVDGKMVGDQRMLLNTR